jgi:thiamine pyrophosphokinase
VQTVIVFAGGDPVAPELRAVLPEPAYVIAADSGLHAADVVGRDVDLLIGDLDSAEPAAVDAAVARGTMVDRHPAAKDATDLELALDAAATRADDVVVVGGAGGRLDHLLANVFLLASPRFASQRIDAHLGDARIAVAHGAGPPLEIQGVAGSVVTLLPVGGAARGVVTEGLEYPLHGDDLAPGTSRGVSNVMLGTSASVTLAEGTLLVVQPTAGAR